MKTGDKVRIYQRPYTREDFEGVAVVRRIISKEKDGDLRIFNAIVNFPDDGPNMVVQRTIVESVVLDIAAASVRGEARV